MSLRTPTFLLALAAALATASCGGNDGEPAPAATLTGVFVDGEVEGLDYIGAAGIAASTNAKGEFSCTPGTTLSFSIGGIALGSAPCAASITPIDLAGVSSLADARLVNRLLLLQLLDEDNDPSNGIKLSATVKAALAGRSLDFSSDTTTFGTALKALLGAVGGAYASRSIDDNRLRLVVEHFEDSLASILGKPSQLAITQTTPLGDVQVTTTRYQIRALPGQYVPYEGSVSKIKDDFPLGFLPSYGSGLAFKGQAANGDLEFYGVTDRGPNGDGPNVPAVSGSGSSGSKIFSAPSFAPSIGVITVGKSGAALGAITPIKVSAGVPASGLPLPEGTLGNSAEVPVNDALRYEPAGKAVFSTAGLDTESLVNDTKRNVFWTSDEYGPFIARIDPATGVVQARYEPGKGLPSILAKRRANRGMEGLALDATTDKLHGFLQSPLTDGNAPYQLPGATTQTSQRVERFARFTRWIEFDPVSGTTTRMLAYPLSGSDYQDGRTGNAKLGDVVALGNGKFIVIEQGAGPSGKVFNKLMLVELGSATDIGAAAFNPNSSDLEKSSMSGAAVNGANWSTVVPLKKTLLLDLNGIGWLAEKAEGLAIVGADTLALVNDNDFGLKTRVFTAAGVEVVGADPTACTVDATGAIVPGSALGCAAGNTIRIARGEDAERPARLWLIKFGKALSSY
jgi:Esterase-like activity of phytase